MTHVGWSTIGPFDHRLPSRPLGCGAAPALRASGISESQTDTGPALFAPHALPFTLRSLQKYHSTICGSPNVSLSYVDVQVQDVN